MHQDISIANKTSSGTTWCSPASELLGGRIVFLTGTIDDELACSIIQQLMILDAQKRDVINLIINSPGGSVSSGLAIIDCMNSISSPVVTFATGIAASMAAVILACGIHPTRSCSPNADILIHQPLAGGISGQVTDIAIAADTLVKKKNAISNLLAKATGKTCEEIAIATERNTWLTPKDALELGIIDRINYGWPQPRRSSL